MLKVYNTLTQQKEQYRSIKPMNIGMYVCGVTVYDHCHLGHARTYLATDIIIRYLRFRGYSVNYVRNITDIDDKIIKRANENNENYQAVTERFTRAMNDDFAALSLLPPDSEPKATDHILTIIELIQQIIANEHAYVGDNGDVYFNVRSMPRYGCLSHHNIEELESGARVEVSDAKRDPLDFVLWKLAKPGEPSWDSPWGAGRPGWHIECSAMSMNVLGKHFDIHMGGRDLIFPHHENELAQSEAATNDTFANYWMHMGYLQIDKEKMSKSLGNFVTIRDALKDHVPEVLRYFVTASHYRSPLTYTEEALNQAKQSLDRLYTALRFLPKADRVTGSRYETSFVEAMDDDFNTPVALSVLFDLAHEIQRLREADSDLAASHGALLVYLAGSIGLLQEDADAYFKSGNTDDVAVIESLIAAREAARADKNWQEADRIRKELADMAVTIEDTSSGTTWKRK